MALGRYLSKCLWLFGSIFGICLALVTKNDSGIQDHELSHLKEIKILELLPYFVDAAIKLRQSKLEQVNWTCMNFKTFPVFSFCLFPKGTLRRDNFFFLLNKRRDNFLKKYCMFCNQGIVVNSETLGFQYFLLLLLFVCLFRCSYYSWKKGYSWKCAGSSITSQARISYNGTYIVYLWLCQT